MAKDKDRSLNPAAAHRKQEKLKALKKGKAVVAASRTARLATRNPSRLERQIADLKSLQESSGSLNTRDKKQLEELERDLVRVKKARTERPDLVPQRGDVIGRGGRGGGILGKRDREGRPRWGQDHSSSEETDEDVKRIPMPRDTPPPVPRRRSETSRMQHRGTRDSANMEPLGIGREYLQDRRQHMPDLALPPKPAALVQKVYESAPQIRDLRKEAVQRFMPSVVKQKIDASKGKGRLLEEDELERLEKEGYGGTTGANIEAMGNDYLPVNAAPAVEHSLYGVRVYGSIDEEQAGSLIDEEKGFATEMALAWKEDDGKGNDAWHANPKIRATMEEVEDEDL
ncbi:MAG: hypothetical protein Q9195_002638 [Heterodermia aff. obscurata]